MAEKKRVKDLLSSDDGGSFNIFELLHSLLSNWYWFVISVVLCLGFAWYKLKKTVPIYERTATILIKDDSSSSMSEAATFNDITTVSTKRNVSNEMLVFTSTRLMQIVARRLHLDVSYQTDDGFRRHELYTQAPVTVRFVDAEETDNISMVVTPVSSKEVLVSDILPGQDSTEDKNYRIILNDTVKMPFGRIVISPTLYYSNKSFNEKIYVSKSNLINVAASFSARLGVRMAIPQSTMLKLSITDSSVPRAEDVLNTLISVYNEDLINDRNQVTINTSNFISERLNIIEKELGNVDSDIETFKKQNRLTDVSTEAGMYLNNSSTYQQESLSISNQLTLAKYIKNYLTDPSKSSSLIPTNTGISESDGNIESSIMAYNAMLLKRDKLISSSSDKNPVVVNLNNSLNAMKQSIVRTVDNIIVALNVKLKNIQAQEARTASRIAAVPTHQKYILSVERQQKIKEELYLYLLNKREENALAQAITESNVRTIDPASGSLVPISPNRSQTWMMALLIGLAIPAAVIVLIVLADNKVRNKKDILNKLSVPFLGEIPKRDKDKKKSKKEEAGEDSDVLVKADSNDSISEAFRIVRTNIDYMRMGDKDKKVIVFTSMFPGAGKTFVSTNLALSFALTGKKTILVDLDIRKGTLSVRSQHHRDKKEVGVTNYLSGNVDNIDEIIIKDKFASDLDMIKAGPVPPNPAELLLSDRLDNLINELKSRYDYIILDNVPVGMIADAAIVNRVADWTIYVIRAGVMTRSQLPEVEELYEEQKFKNMSVILNDVDFRKFHGYGYGYSYGYGYGYGYGNNKKSRKKK